jgi:hypothetical protein
MPPGGNYFDQCTVRNSGIGSMEIERKYVLVWAIALAIVFCWMLFGLLFLLIRTTEVLHITVYEAPNGSRVDVNGVSSKDTVGRLQSALQTMAQYGVQNMAQYGVPAGVAPSVSPYPAGVAPVWGPGNQPGPAGYPVPPPPPSGQAAPVSGVSCPKCGAPIEAGSAYCAHCGTSLGPPH